MSYLITKTNGSIVSTTTMPNGTLLDGTTDSSTGLTLIGRNFPNFGQIQNDNFIRLVENFANSTPPTISLSALSTLTGTLWYDTVNKKLRVYDGTNWNLVGGSIVSATAPTPVTYTLIIGDQWWDTVNTQLNVWNGTTWIGSSTGELNTVHNDINANVTLLSLTVGQLRADTGTYMSANVAAINSTIGQLRADTGTYMSANVATINSTIGQLRADTGTYMSANVAAINSTLATDYATKSYVSSSIVTAANTSPTFINATLNGVTTFSGSILPSSNVAVNIGDGTHWFNTIYGKSTQAIYADLAEKYLPDAEYETGTVVVVGGLAEVTACNGSLQRPIGAISENPAYMMNSKLEGGVYVALKGRVPVKVTGPINKGDMLIAGPNGTAIAKVLTGEETFAIALETNTDTGVKLIEAVIL